MLKTRMFSLRTAALTLAVATLAACGAQGEATREPEPITPDSNTGSDGSVATAPRAEGNSISDSVSAEEGDNTDIRYV
ncbi:MAG: hypothetical protein KC561_17365, partial [Myxococcales bacterium]|nr:hypothetical protein [Myxococcales bacterium]